MEPTFYTRVDLHALSLDRAAREYVDWALGLHAHEKRRRGRLESGVDEKWFAKQLLSTITLHGKHDCTLEARRGGGLYLMRFVHRDRDPASGLLWHNYVRITELKKGITLEHGVARSAPKGVTLTPVAAPPAVIKTLLDVNGPGVTPKEFWDSAPIPVPADEIEYFISDMLMDSDRRAPVLLLTPTSDTGKLVLPADVLAEKLVGIARVAFLTDDASTFKLRGAFESRGMPRQFGCYDGAAKLYEPKITKKDSPYRHYLWYRDQLERVPAEKRAEVLAGEVSARAVRSGTPVGFFRVIDQFDRDERKRAVQLLLDEKRAEAQTVAAALTERDQTLEKLRGSFAATLAERDVAIEKLKTSLAEAQAEAEGYLNMAQGTEKELLAAQEKATELEQELAETTFDSGQKSGVIDKLERKLAQLESDKVKGAVAPDVRAALDAVMRDGPTPEQALKVIVALYGDRIVVLPSAVAAAKESEAFHHKARAFELVKKLATKYWDALANGEAKGVFTTSEFAPTESETVMKNKRAKKLRTFTYKGEDVVMLKHLKIGVKESVAETWRLHFEWFADEKKIVIGHSGPHLDHD